MRNKYIVALMLNLYIGPALASSPLRVCADPNNLPYSNAAKEGYENKIARLIAGDLGREVTYVWAQERENFVKKTLNAGLCDVIIGIPAGLDSVETTQPYYASTYVFVYRRTPSFHLASLKDQRLKSLKIGVHLIGDEAVPPGIALGEEGIVDNVQGFVIYGDYAKANPPARLVEAVQNRDIDVAAIWGPIGGYFAKHSTAALEVTPISGTEAFVPLVFRYDIAMGVRKGDEHLRRELDGVIMRYRNEIRNILVAYGVPLVPIQGGSRE